MKLLIRLMAVFMFVTLSSLSGCSDEPEDSTGEITGYVTEAPGGTEPISGVTVTIGSTGQSTTTGNTGAFTFRNMQPGSYSLQFAKTGYVTNSRNVSVMAGNESNCDIQLVREKEEAQIEINPSSLNFGTSQTDMTVTIKNNGNTTASWSLELGNNPWLSVSQLGGSIQGGRTQSITFTVNRDYLSESRTIVVNLQAFGNSYPITVSCAPRNTTSYMVIEPTTLTFGSSTAEQTFTIRNTGTSVLTWTATNVNAEYLSLSSSAGTISAGGNNVVIVTADMEKVKEDLVTTFVISDGVKDQPITVNIKKSGGSGSEDPGDDPENPYNDIVVKNGLLVYFPFNGNFTDYSGNEVQGYGSPEPTFSDDGVVEGTKSAKFSKTAKSAFIVSDGLIDTRAMTICFWSKNISEGSIFHVTSSNKKDGGEEMMALEYYDGHLKYVVSRYAYHYQYSTTGNFTHSNIADEKWHHIALVSDYNKSSYANVTTLLYIDGNLMDTVTEHINPFSESETGNEHFGTGTKFILGGKGVPNMLIADLRVYDSRLLSSEEIKQIYTAKQ